jgi:hypothetical protein
VADETQYWEDVVALAVERLVEQKQVWIDALTTKDGRPLFQIPEEELVEIAIKMGGSEAGNEMLNMLMQRRAARGEE